MPDGSAAEDVRAAAAGDQAAWDRLVDRFSGLVWSVVRGYGLDRSDAADVSQTTWLRLIEHLPRLRQPERVGVWLATTARHEALRAIRRRSRIVPVDFEFELGPPQQPPEAETRLLDRERDAALWQAFESLSAPCQTLLRVLMATPPPSYLEVSAALEMPVGSIGPRRARCLDRLRAIAKRDEKPLRRKRAVV